MKIQAQEAIKKITEAGFSANLWVGKSGITRIYIDFKFQGSPRKGGFLGSDKNDLRAQLCGSKTAKYQAMLNEFGTWEIEWPEVSVTQAEINAHQVGRRVLADYHYSNRAERDRMIDLCGWVLSHDL